MSSPRLCLDTGALIGHLRAVGRRTSPLDELPDGELVISAITVLELWQGARDGEFEATAELVAACTVVDLTGAVAAKAGQLIAHMRTQGRTLGLADAAIAATALLSGGLLLTTNAAEFAGISGLEVVSLAGR